MKLIIITLVATGALYALALGSIVSSTYSILAQQEQSDYTAPTLLTKPSTVLQTTKHADVQPSKQTQTTKPVQTTAPVVTQQAATEQNCQYPDRYNSDGSCDNSDPACPETLKDPMLKGACE